MTNINNRQEGELDLFDLIEILKKRKYLVISIFMISIFAGSIYNYWFVYKIPSEYSISIAVHLPHEEHINNKFFNQLDGWFASGAYKSALKEKHAMLNIPRINTKVHNPAFAQIRMVYPSAEKGKQILKDVLEILRESLMLKEFYGDLENSTKQGIKSNEDRLNEFKFEFNKNKILIEKLQFKKQSNKVNIERLKSKQKKLDKSKNNFIVKNEDSQIYNQLYYDYKDEINLFISYLDKDIQQIEYDILLENDRLNEIKKKMVSHQNQVDFLQGKIVSLKKPYHTEAPPFAELLPSKKMSEMTKILAITGIVGFLIAGFIAFLLELKDRHHGLVP